jgi:hypothetical protein
MARYNITTLIDITRSNPDRTDTDSLKLGQQANFNSLIQAIGLRANPEWRIDPKRFTGQLPEPFKGKAAYWTWEFDSERDDVFLEDNNPVGLLIKDLHGVPVVPDLTNTADITPAAFQTVNGNANTHVDIIS